VEVILITWLACAVISLAVIMQKGGCGWVVDICTKDLNAFRLEDEPYQSPTEKEKENHCHFLVKVGVD
jgi:hypothetical protein